MMKAQFMLILLFSLPLAAQYSDEVCGRADEIILETVSDFHRSGMRHLAPLCRPRMAWPHPISMDLV